MLKSLSVARKVYGERRLLVGQVGRLSSVSAKIDAYTGKVSQIVDSGAAKFFTIDQEKTVFDAVKQMVEHNCGSLIVKEKGKVVGIVTERDYLRKIITQDKASKKTTVKEIMTNNVISVDATSTVGESMRIMANNNIRHLPVLQNNELVGVISMRELVRKIQRMAIVISEGSSGTSLADNQ